MELISREQAIDAVRMVIGDNRSISVCDAIKQLPSIQPKRGKWIRDGHHIRCDQCGMYMCDTDREGDRIPTEFCPNCGAKMEVSK